jgi:hypothetical protein
MIKLNQRAARKAPPQAAAINKKLFRKEASKFIKDLLAKIIPYFKDGIIFRKIALTIVPIRLIQYKEIKTSSLGG